MAWNRIARRIKDAWAVIKAIAQTIVTGIQNIFKLDWSQIGKNIVLGIANGIKAGIQWVVDAARNVARAAVDAAKGFLGINSPSKVMMGLGQDTAMGFAKGIQANNTMDISGALNLDPLVSKIDNLGGAPAAAPVAASGGSVYNITIENPKKETSEESIRRLLKGLSYVGVVS
jgi:phage-related protein